MNTLIKWFRGITISLFAILALTLTWSFVSPNNRYFEIVKNLELFANVFKEVNEYYVDDINPSQLLDKGVKKMLGNLDPYTVYISEDKIEDFRTLNTGQYAGIGASTVLFNGHTYVSMVYKDFSAYKQGLRIGDEIIKVDGVNIAGLSQEKLNQLVKGQAKSKVSLTVNRPGTSDPVELRFEREKISIPNVPYSGMLNNEVGYIKFTEFTPNGYKNVKKALQELMKEGAQGIVLDLRHNLGGLLKEAVDISNLFLPPNLEVVHTKGKVKSSKFTYSTTYNPLAPDVPLIVLVDNMSASASEIVAGTLQDYDRAVLIGQKTYGKGLVQNVRNLPYHSQVKLTIAKYYIPSGRCIQAVDYAHRHADGSVGKIPDSLKVAFSTKNGRTVFDGGGIDPEVILKRDYASELARQLVAKGYIFNYASEYALHHNQIPEAKTFNLSDEEFSAFVKWLEKEPFKYVNPLEKNLKELKEASDKYKGNESVKNNIQKIEKKLNQPLVTVLSANKKEIKRLLEANIASRYYLEPGLIEAGLGDDPYVAKAIEVLDNKAFYQKLLTPNKP